MTLHFNGKDCTICGRRSPSNCFSWTYSPCGHWEVCKQYVCGTCLVWALTLFERAEEDAERRTYNLPPFPPR